MLQPAPAATWAINSTPSVKAKATTPRRARMLAMLKQLTIARIPPLTAATCHAYVVFNALFNVTWPFAYLLQIFFNAYVLSENGIPQGLYCSMYNETWAPSYGNNYGQYRTESDGTVDRYTVSDSYSYSLSS